ncbi:protein of unknown function [Loktanella sp. DSM 29012]|uniref:DUF1127 domain-containing protein n=1 Tax=Loktanella gaetbuli TaxID=2881335 RepID=A0ABS8BPQ9_9RHOB|nr:MULTISPECIES: DUF1127 domain-containing protein [Loktanella]KQI69455.1 hypothetical protein AN189_03345 [Loktanella sp. 3ANDIMAR09]MCB5197617.1 DUF1127 domain-containing protein [Loktanella gaetbuli]SEP95975.1 protein of unknown function [Loktanella sp. DSM 29012]
MAYTNTNVAPSLTQRFAGLRKQIADAAAKRRVYRNTVNELSALTNRELADLGISRSMIRSIATEAAYGN